MRNLIFLGAVISCTLYSCVKAPSYSIIPHVEFISASPYVRSGDTAIISFSFTDGDGDIGPSSLPPDTNTHCCNNDTSCFFLSQFNIFLIENREPNYCVSGLQSPDLRPAGKYKDISGTMEVHKLVDNTKCIQCDANCFNSLDTLTFTIVIRDLAGHFSNRIQTSPIVIGCAP